jgi:histidine triad (HIT) family protein
MADCLFCRIGRHELEADILFESDAVVAFRDVRPVAPTHVLVISRRHIESAAELGGSDGGILAEIFETIAGLAAQEKLDGGWRIVTNVGPDAGQSVPHLHFHLLGGRKMTWPPG